MPPGDSASAFAWDAKDHPIDSGRDASGFFVRSPAIVEPGVAVVAKSENGFDLSGIELRMRYRLKTDATALKIALKPARTATNTHSGMIPSEITTELVRTGAGEAEIRFQLPATPGLVQTKEVVLTFGTASKGRPLDLTILSLSAASR